MNMSLPQHCLKDQIDNLLSELPKQVRTVVEASQLRQGKEMKKDPVVGKTFDAATGKAIATDPTTGRTLVDDDTENDVGSVPVIIIDQVTGTTIIVDPVKGSVVDETTGAPNASLGSLASPASLTTGSIAQMTSGPQISKGSSDSDENDDAEMSNAKVMKSAATSSSAASSALVRATTE